MEMIKKLQETMLPMINTTNYNEVMSVIYECGSTIIDLEKRLETATAYKAVENKLTELHRDMKDLAVLEMDIERKEQTIGCLEFELSLLKAEVMRLRDCNTSLYKNS